MINANELRIGNWVQLEEDGEILQIKISALAATEIFVDPIPLTPEILEKCGFEKESELSWKHKKNSGLRIVEGGGLFMVYKGTVGAIAPATHLHQLQNLYFALTGTEIEYNPLPPS